MSQPEAPLRVVYMGTPEFAVPPLRALLESEHQVVGVFTNPDRESGRGKRVTRSPVKALAAAHEVPVYQPERIRRNPEAIQAIRALEPDLIVVVAYGQILPQEVLDLARLECLNVHASLLPAYRGAAPINWCLVHGERLAGVTIMRMERGLDTGPMYLKANVDVDELLTAGELHDRLSELGAPLLLEAIEGIRRGALQPEPQDDALATWAPMIKKRDGQIDWTRPAQEIANLIRGFNPWPGAYSDLIPAPAEPSQRATRVKFHLARGLPEGALRGERAAPGEVLGEGEEQSAKGEVVRIACGGLSVLEVITLQLPGKRAMSARDLLNGHAELLQPGARFAPRERTDA